jgi:hypothetical protein
MCNLVEDATNTGIALDFNVVGLAGSRNGMILGNLIKSTTTPVVLGIRISTSMSECLAAYNIVDNADTGVRVTTARSDQSGFRIHYNSLRTEATAGQCVAIRRDDNVDGVEVIGNRGVTGNIGVRFETGSGTLSNVKVLDNDFRGVTNEISGELPQDLQLRHTVVGQTTDATATNILTLTLPDESAYFMGAKVVGRQSDTSNRACYNREALVYRNAGGGATIQGSVSDVTTIESDANWNATITVSGNNASVTVTGIAATTINWKAEVELLGAQ